MGGLLASIVSAVICLILPKFLSLFSSGKNNHLERDRNQSGITSFPYCTVYKLTGSEWCKFSPQFCERCSSYRKSRDEKLKNLWKW
ncbi:hypothetical protein FLX35_04240 [Cylindrospermopsis raciborskii LB2897]|nr:hypothetical protein [Cylindrospermopsis raciborskii LB2897]